MSSPLLQLPDKKAAFLVEFLHGAGFGTPDRYTDAIGGLVVGGNSYTGVPTLDLKYGEDVGGTGPKPHTIKIEYNANDSFLYNISSGEPHSEIRVNVYEHWDDGASPETYRTAIRTVSRVRLNPDGETQILEIDLVHALARLADLSSGIVAIEKCPLTFLGGICQKSTSGTRFESGLGTITAVGHKSLTLSSIPTVPTPKPDNPWVRGFVEVDGLRLLIRKWDSGTPLVIHTHKAVPERWDGASVTRMQTGCGKQVTACRAWDNEERFLGVGRSMPAADPNTEIPTVPA